ncbi:hypothetical protein, partial [Arthrobacter sp. lap29]|uniref:hypothetical protein n=1 Tax=Arthrobacter sp. lap29 TaxID=3056122 RepID=UPI0028F71374
FQNHRAINTNNNNHHHSSRPTPGRLPAFNGLPLVPTTMHLVHRRLLMFARWQHHRCDGWNVNPM